MKTTDENEKLEKIKTILIHEAGHALFYYLIMSEIYGEKFSKTLLKDSKMEFNVVRINSELCKIEGKFERNIPAEYTLRDKHDYIFVLLGGLAAEYYYNKNIDWEEYIDRLLSENNENSDLIKINRHETAKMKRREILGLLKQFSKNYVRKYKKFFKNFLNKAEVIANSDHSLINVGEIYLSL